MVIFFYCERCILLRVPHEKKSHFWTLSLAQFSNVPLRTGGVQLTELGLWCGPLTIHIPTSWFYHQASSHLCCSVIGAVLAIQNYVTTLLTANSGVFSFFLLMGSLETNKLLVSLNPNTIKIYSFTPTGPGSILQKVLGLFMRLNSTPESPSNPDSCESQANPCVSQRLGFFSSWRVDIAWAVWMHLDRPSSAGLV